MKAFHFLFAAILLLLPPMVYADEPTALETKSGLYLIVIDESGSPTFIKLNVIRVDGNVPVTPTTPTVPDVPAVVPDGAFGLTKLAYEAAMELPDEDREKAKEMAKVFASTLEATHQKTVSETIGLMNLVLGGNKGDWVVWWELVVERLQELEREGKFRKIEESKQAWKAIADGLEVVK